jgi:plastocyanin
MIWRSVILFSLSLLPAQAAGPATVSGRFELTDSRERSVRQRGNFSGVVVWLEPVGRASPPPMAPRRAQMLQKNKEFQPHVLAIPVGSTVDFPNADPIFHNAFSNFSGQVFDIGLYPPGSSRAEVFHHAGIVRVFCNIHPTMTAVIAVLPTPWFATSSASGEFRIDGVPPGDYDLQVFHERTLPETLKGLGRRIAVPPGGVTLPRIAISETGFLPTPHLNKHGRPYPPATSDSTYPGAPK